MSLLIASLNSIDAIYSSLTFYFLIISRLWYPFLCNCLLLLFTWGDSCWTHILASQSTKNHSSVYLWCHGYYSAFKCLEWSRICYHIWHDIVVRSTVSLSYESTQPVTNNPLIIQGIAPYGIYFSTLEVSYHIVVFDWSYSKDTPTHVQVLTKFFCWLPSTQL